MPLIGKNKSGLDFFVWGWEGIVLVAAFIKLQI
jgi:hypothetical protein